MLKAFFFTLTRGFSKHLYTEVSQIPTPGLSPSPLNSSNQIQRIIQLTGRRLNSQTRLNHTVKADQDYWKASYLITKATAHRPSLKSRPSPWTLLLSQIPCIQVTPMLELYLSYFRSCPLLLVYWPLSQAAFLRAADTAAHCSLLPWLCCHTTPSWASLNAEASAAPPRASLPDSAWAPRNGILSL